MLKVGPPIPTSAQQGLHIISNQLKHPVMLCRLPSSLAMASKVLVLNSGSSSLKFKLFENTRETLRAVVSGVVERIGDPESTVGFQLGPVTMKQQNQVL